MKLGERPVIFFVQDEAIFKQNILTKKIWAHKVKFWIITKDEEYGVMMSTFQYQDFGFRYPLIVLDIQTVNLHCALHPKYVDTDALTAILGHNNK